MAYLRVYKENEAEEKLRAERAMRYSGKFGTKLPESMRGLVEKHLGRTILGRHDEFHGLKAKRNPDGSVILFEQKCGKCSRIWNASVKIPCPYCRVKQKSEPVAIQLNVL